MSQDAWDELREMLGPLGERGARALSARIRAQFLRQPRGWNVALHLTGSRDPLANKPKLTMAWVEPPEQLTDEAVQAQNTRDGRSA